MNRTEQGFTLIELLVAISITTIIIGAVGTAVIVALKNVDATQTRMAESHDAQMASAFLVPDVQSATTITTTQPKCGAISTAVASFNWSDQGTTNAATYTLESANGERRLLRSYLVGGTAQPDVVVAHELVPTCADPTVDDPAITVTTSCAAAVCPTKVAFRLTDATGYQFSVTGERRVR
jgi:prepilin-type N-terminal cleavage/methylation domain-containing protein